MIEKLKKSWWVAAILVAAMGSLVAWRMESRRADREQAATQERIRTEAQQSIGRAMQNVRMCPLSEPNCNERRP
jgi:hypothetical protein